MSDSELVSMRENTIRRLDGIKQTDQRGFDYWHARDLQKLLGYIEWRSFKEAIQRAKMACESSGNIASHHFGDTNKVMAIGRGAKREIEDIVLTRYACYLIAMNGEPSKPEIAAAQAYFAVQTRKQEIAEQQSDIESRIILRERVRHANKELNSAAKGVGVENYAFFHDAGYKGLYGGLRLSEIKKEKGLQPKEDLLDRAGRAELAANEFRITQTEIRLRNEKIQGQKQAEDIHNFVGKKVRETMKKTSGTMPEDLPPEPPIKQLKKAKSTKKLPPSSL
jgi:DNA-damage-inducible protein D